MVVRNISEAKAQLSALVEAVLKGDEVILAKAGKPVAKIIPIRADDGAADKARAALLEHLRSQKPMDIGRWTRDELYDETL